MKNFIFIMCMLASLVVSAQTDSLERGVIAKADIRIDCEDCHQRIIPISLSDSIVNLGGLEFTVLEAKYLSNYAVVYIVDDHFILLAKAFYTPEGLLERIYFVDYSDTKFEYTRIDKKT